MATTQEIGRRGERAAAAHLRAHGFEILHTNWRDGRYELDIVARREGVIHFVEVKCRKAGALTPPEDAITPAKFRALQSAARLYLARYRIDAEVQFDLVAVDHSGHGTDLRYIPNAMIPRW